jgi:hypothetical protein
MSMENHDGMMSTGGTPDSSTRVLWQLYQESRLVVYQEDLCEGSDRFFLRNITFILIRVL